MQVLMPLFSCIAVRPRSILIDRRAAVKTLIYRLTLIHRKIDDEIRGELARRFPDSLKLLRLKKLRLAVKDRLYRRVLSSSAAA